MNRVTKRTWIMGLFLAVLLGGMMFFLWEYVTQAGEWVTFPGSPHVYNNANIGCGTVTDRSGNVLLDITEERTYSSDAATRQSTLHWLGDRKGYISASAVSHYAGKMAGFDLVSGVYDSSGEGGEMTLTLSARVQNAALDCVPDILDKTFTCYGAYEYGTEKVTCEKAHGTLTLKTALANSCNCSFAQIAELVGKKNMVKYVEQFGVTDSLSFDGVTTAEGNYDISNTAPVSFAWSCIGQHTDLINPARYMTFMGAIAGGGVGAEPYLVSEVRSGEEMTYEAKTKTTGRIMSQDVADQVKAYMRNNVQSVYGDWNFNGMNVCAKSGTSQLGGGQKSNAMFAGFVEDEQYPLAFIVVVENGGYGSATCVPVLSKVLAACKSVLDGE